MNKENCALKLVDEIILLYKRYRDFCHCAITVLKTELLQYIIYNNFRGIGYLTNQSCFCNIRTPDFSTARSRQAVSLRLKKEMAAGTVPFAATVFFVPS